MKVNKIVAPVLVLSGLLLFILLTDPYNLPLATLLVPFGLIGLSLFLLVQPFLHSTLHFELSKSRIWAGLIAFSSVILLLLSSLHQLNWRDLIIVGMFSAVFLWYFGRLTH